MKEREPEKEKIGKGELLYLRFPEIENLFAGYGLTTHSGSKEFLTGLLMVDRPRPADPEWLREIKEAYGDYQLVPMTSSGERGIVCRMQIEPNSQPYLGPAASQQSAAIKEALEPLLDTPPSPVFIMRWDDEIRYWRSIMTAQLELPEALRQVFQATGYGCFAAELSIGIIHVCHAPDEDIEGFSGKPVSSRWQLVNMPTAPLIRLELAIQDRPGDPYRFESFLNVAAADQAHVLGRLAKHLHPPRREAVATAR
jgi:hypothetical protein